MISRQVTSAGARSGAAPAALRLLYDQGAARLEVGEGFPSVLRPLCDPQLISAAGEAGDAPAGAATLLRGYRVGDDLWTLALRTRRTEGGGRETAALALPGALMSAKGPAVAAALPTLLDLAAKSASAADLSKAIDKLAPEGDAKARDCAEAAAARLLAALTRDDWTAAPASALVEAGEEAAFWRAVGAFLALAPSALRPAVSAVYSENGAAEAWMQGATLRPAASCEAVAAEDRKRASDIFASLADEAPAPLRFVAGAALDEGLDGAFAARLSSALRPAGRALKKYAIEPDAASPAPESPSEILAAAEAAIEALRTGRSDGAAAPSFGVARCVGWLAGRADAVRLWPALEARGSGRAEWRALSLAEPAEAGPIVSLGALTRLAWAEAEARAAAPEGVETPFDAPVFKERLKAAALAGLDQMTEDPLALLDPATPVEGFGEALQGRDPRILSRPIDAMELAAEAPARETERADLAALAKIARTLRQRSGLSAHSRFGRLATDISHPQAAILFGACWVHCLSVGAWSGAAFWRDRFIAWCEDRGERDGEGVEDALVGLRRIAGGAGPAGAHVLSEAIFAGAGGPPAAPSVRERKPRAEAAPPERREHLSADALHEAMAALRQSEEAEADEVPPQDKARKGAAAAPEGALADAAVLIGGFRDDYAAEVARRAKGRAPKPLELAFEDKKGFAVAIDAAATLALDDPPAAAAAYGEAIAWALRQAAGLGRKPAARPPFEAAPDSVRRVWGALAEELEAPGEEAEFLAFLSKLLQAHRARRLGSNLGTDGLVNALQGASVTKMVGTESISFSKTTLRDYLYQGRRGEPKGGFEALDDEGASARLDRALLVFAMLRSADGGAAADPLELIDPLAVALDGPELRGLTPSDAALTRLGRYLAEADAPADAHGAALEALMQSRGLVQNTALAQLWRRVPRRV